MRLEGLDGQGQSCFGLGGLGWVGLYGIGWDRF